MRAQLRIAVSLLAVCLSGFALSGCGDSPATAGKDIDWTLEEGVLTISGTGGINDFETDTAAPWNESMLDDVTVIVVGDGITHIGQYAFTWAISLESAEIAGSVESIGGRAFEYCGLDSDSVEITFTGDAPSFAEDAFETCESNITICYPADNETWDSVIDQNYGAEQIEWIETENNSK